MRPSHSRREPEPLTVALARLPDSVSTWPASLSCWGVDVTPFQGRPTTVDLARVQSSWPARFPGRCGCRAFVPSVPCRHWKRRQSQPKLRAVLPSCRARFAVQSFGALGTFARSQSRFVRRPYPAAHELVRLARRVVRVAVASGGTCQHAGPSYRVAARRVSRLPYDGWLWGLLEVLAIPWTLSPSAPNNVHRSHV